MTIRYRSGLTTQSLQDHAREIAAAHNVRIVEHVLIKPDEAFAEAKRRIVFTAPISEATTYAVAMHETGHLVAALGVLCGQPGDQRKLTLDEEFAAWEWAEHYALEWTPEMEAVKQYALGTYGVVPVAEKPAEQPTKPVIAWEPEPAPVAPQAPSINWADSQPAKPTQTVSGGAAGGRIRWEDYR